MIKLTKKPELLSPVQDFTSLAAAIENGADAVFLVLKDLICVPALRTFR